MNVNEYGVRIRLGTGFDLSSSPTLTFHFAPPTQSPFTRPGTLGIVQVVTPAGTFPANTWAYYEFAQGDVTEEGTWGVRLYADNALPQQLISDPATFIVRP